MGRLRPAAPCRVANAGRNSAAGWDRRRRWGPARDALWDFLEPWLEDGWRIGIVGAGNGDDLPLRRIAGRAGEIVLIDIDPRAARGARRRLGRGARRKVEVIGHDVTGGTADRIVLAAHRDTERDAGRVAPAGGRDIERDAGRIEPAGGRDIEREADPIASAAGRDGDRAGEGCDIAPSSPTPLPGAPYDVVVGDLFYSQLLYPALLDLGVDEGRRAGVLADHGPPLTRAVVARLHASAPCVVHIHDPLAWWDGHEQPVALADVIGRAAAAGPEAALDLVARGIGPTESDPRAALTDLGLPVAATSLWRWPFSQGVDYLACATLARSRR